MMCSFKEVESGKRNDRPELEKALGVAKAAGATLLIAKLDRLARNVAFIANLMDGEVEVAACDMPEANRFMLHVMAAVAEHEARATSERTKAALAARKARGLPCGWAIAGRGGDQARATANAAKDRMQRADAFAIKIGPQAASLRQDGLSLKRIAEQFNQMGVPTARTGKWYDTTIGNLLKRYEAVHRV